MGRRDHKATGSIDTVDSVAVSGWFHAPGGEAARIEIAGTVIPVRADQPRPDVLAAGAAPVETVGFMVEFAGLEPLAREAMARMFDGRWRKAVLFAGDRRVASRRFRLGKQFHLEISHHGDGWIEGWAAARDWPRPVSVELLADGRVIDVQPLTRVDAERAKASGMAWGCDFSARLPCAVSGRQVTVSARIADSLGQTEPSIEIERPLHAAHDVRVSMARSGAARRSETPVAIIIPVFNAPEALERCLGAVERFTTRPAHAILIDDASDDPRVGAILGNWAEGRDATLIRNQENLGYTRSVNLGIEAAGNADVVLLNSDARVGPRWLEMLEQAAYGAPEIGSATAVSDNAGAFSFPCEGPQARPKEFSDAQWQRLVAQASGLLQPETPTGSGFCMFIKRGCLRETGLFDEAAFPRGYGEENEWCLRAGVLGWRHVVDERCYVLHDRSASFGAEKKGLLEAGQAVVRARHPDYPSRVSRFLTGAPMRLARARAQAALAAADPARPPRPRALFVISASQGGTPMTNADLMAALQDRWDTWLLRSDSRTLTLSQVTGRETREVETWKLARPVDPADHRSAEYDAVLARWLSAYAFELVHIRHLAWHGLDLPKVAQELSIPVLFSFHDFYALCPTVKLLDAEGRYCAGACTPPGETDCVPDLWTGRETPPLRHAWIDPWRAYMRRMLNACDGYATTSQGTRDLLTRWFPELSDRPFAVIAHGRDFPSREGFAPPRPQPGERLRVLVLGGITIAKGAGLIGQALDAGAGEAAEFHVLGEAPGLEPRPGLTVHGSYRREALPERIARIAPHLGASLSIWPETWSHTLTELWRAGLPVVGSGLGAPGERIGSEGPGWLFDPAEGGAAMAALLARLASEPEKIAHAQSEAAAWSRSEAGTRTAGRMAADYEALYRVILDARRAFARPSQAEGV